MIAVMYHYIRDTNRGPRVHALSPATFLRQLDWFEANGGVIDARTFLHAPDSCRGKFLLTFDDGLKEHRQIAHELQRRNLSGFFFASRLTGEGGILNPQRLHLLLAAGSASILLGEVDAAIQPHMLEPVSVAGFDRQLYRNQVPTEAEKRLKMLFNYHLRYEYADALLAELFRKHLGRDQAWLSELYLSPDDLREMARHHIVGNHSYRHRVLARLSEGDQYDEIMAAHTWLEQVTGQPSRTFCYPYGIPGSYSVDTLAILDRLDYRCAFKFDNGEISRDASLLEINRMDCNRFADA